ncbi:helix-loop-helix DNA-binding domain-containing protein [Ditylenchus destructor]|uniref:Helix-loop-helix DNA-binding domain-containing protein n=1 Tax=Ditylenchus destructor TaxID=166010 RepID=A0AAD4NJ86_9BILA|nr:helix-loop-helix DNA-binding domain-containing protein [Ditylenchus destructor]
MEGNRERQRQSNVRQAFDKLRRVIPAYPPDRKMSKSEILRTAIRYITILEYCLDLRSAPVANLFAEPI